MGRPRYEAPTQDDEPVYTDVPEGQTTFNLDPNAAPTEGLGSRRGNPNDIVMTEDPTPIESNRPDPKEIVATSVADSKPEEESKYPSLTDEDRLEYLALAKAEGVPLSKINPDKFGGDPAAFMIEQSFNRAKEAGWSNKEYKAAIDEELVNAGYDLKEFTDEEGNVYDRFQTGLANTLTEMWVGGKELVGAEVTPVEAEMNKILFREKKQKEAYYKYANATMENGEDADGNPIQTMDSNFDISGGMGELAPSLVLGLGTGAIAAKAGTTMGRALLGDMAAQQALSTMEFSGAVEADSGAGTQYMFETGANAIGFGIGNMLGSIGKKAATPVFEKAVSDMGKNKAADTLETIKFAEEQGIKLLGSDIDPGTQFSQLVEAAKSNPTLSAKLKDITKEDIEVMTDYLSKVKNGYNDVMQTDANTGQYISKVIDAQEEAFDVSIGKAYDDMDAMMANSPSMISNENFTGWLGTVKTSVNNKTDITPKVRKSLQSSIDEYITDYQATGQGVNVASMYNIMRDTISEASSLSKQVDKGSEAKAYAQLAEIFEKQFDSMANIAGKNNPVLEETIGKAKSLYKERVELFGYRGTGKGGKGTGFISSFREKYLKDPEGAMKLVNTPEKVREIKNIAGEAGDTMGILQRNYVDKLTTKPNGVPFSMEEGGKQLSNPKNSAMLNELYGAEGAKQLDNIGKVMTIIGKRERALTRGSSLVANEILGKGLLQAVPTAVKFIAGKVKGRGLVKADRTLLKGIEKEMEKKIGMSLDEFQASIKGSQILPASVDVGRTADELYQSPQGVPTKAEGETTQAEIQAIQTAENEARKSEVAQQTALEGMDRQLQRQQTNLNKEITTRFRTKKVTPDDRLEYNRIQESIVTARNAGDRSAVNEAISELSAFTEHTKNLPSRETTTEEAARIAIEKETARVKRIEAARVATIRREEEALARVEREEAERALQAEATQANAERVVEARRLARERRLEIDAAREARERVAAEQPSRVTTAQRRDSAAETMNARLNKTLGEGWSITTGAGDSHPRFYNSNTEEYFSLHLYTDSMGATTVGLRNGSGAGEKIYHAMFDMAEEIGVYYKPDSHLLTANPVRTGMNMISYMAKRGEDANHIMMSPSQKAIGTRGTENYLGNKRLTLKNANKLAMNMKGLVNRKLPTGVNLSGTTTDEAIEQMASVTGGDSNTRLGSKSLKLIRDFLKSGSNLGTMGAVLGLMLANEEIMAMLEDGEDGSQGAI